MDQDKPTDKLTAQMTDTDWLHNSGTDWETEQMPHWLITGFPDLGLTDGVTD